MVGLLCSSETTHAHRPSLGIGILVAVVKNFSIHIPSAFKNLHYVRTTVVAFIRAINPVDQALHFIPSLEEGLFLLSIGVHSALNLRRDSAC